jgi:uncharacterized membrane protein
MGVTKTRSTRRSRNRNRKFVLMMIGVGLLLSALVFTAIAAVQRNMWEPTRISLMVRWAIGFASAGALALFVRQFIGLEERFRRNRRRKRYESYKVALDSDQRFEIPEDWEEQE